MGDELPRADAARTRRPRHRSLLVAVALVAVLVGLATYVERTNPRGISLSHPLGYQPSEASALRDNEAATALATVERRSLSTQTQLEGTLAYAGAYTILGQAPGTVTWLPDAGQVVENGEVLYRVNGAPVVLLYGATPDYRVLAADMRGVDVAQLNRDLVALGYEDSRDVDASWDEFSWATTSAVEKLQHHFGVDGTGRLPLGAVVFLPTAARVTSLAANLGGPATGAVMTATSTARIVNVALDADLQSEIKAGDHVMITLPDNSTTPGTVTALGRVATIPPNNSGGNTDGSPTLPLTIQPSHPATTGSLDQAPVVVSIIDQTVTGVLAVPVNALLALAGGAYAVEAVAGDGLHRLVRVTPGLFDDAAGMVEVSGSGLAAGQRVVVPGND